MAMFAPLDMSTAKRAATARPPVGGSAARVGTMSRTVREEEEHYAREDESEEEEDDGVSPVPAPPANRGRTTQQQQRSGPQTQSVIAEKSASHADTQVSPSNSHDQNGKKKKNEREPIDYLAHLCKLTEMSLLKSFGYGPSMKKQMSKTIRLYMSWTGRLGDFQVKSAAAFWRPMDNDTFKTRTKYANNAPVSKKRQGDLKNVLVHSMTMIQFNNGFPCLIGLTFPGFYHARGNFRLGDGKQYAYLFYANTAVNQARDPIMIESPYLDSAFLDQYPGYNPDTIFTKGVFKDPDTECHYVKENHPVMEYIRKDPVAAQELDNLPPEMGGYYQIADPLYFQAMKSLEDEGRVLLPLMNMEKFHSKIERPGMDWDAQYEVCDNLSEKLREAVFENIYTLQCTVEITYRFMA